METGLPPRCSGYCPLTEARVHPRVSLGPMPVGFPRGVNSDIEKHRPRIWSPLCHRRTRLLLRPSSDTALRKMAACNLCKEAFELVWTGPALLIKLALHSA